MFAILYAYKCILLCSLSQIGGSIYLNFTLKKHRIKIISLNSELELKKSNPNNKMNNLNVEMCHPRGKIYNEHRIIV